MSFRIAFFDTKPYDEDSFSKMNDIADAGVIDTLVKNGVKLLALRCAGYNNVDLAAAEGRLPVVRVPAYSPYAVAEYTLALMLALNRRIPRATWRTRDGNFSLHGLMGFDMHEKTIGIIGIDTFVERFRNAYIGLRPLSR